VDGTSVYWTTYNGGTVMRVPIGGGTATTLASGQNVPAGIGVGPGAAFWVNQGVPPAYATGGSVGQAPLDGGTASTLAPANDPGGIAVDSANVYWTNNNSGTVMKIPVGGGTAVTVAANQSGPLGVAVDATSVFWTNYSGGTVMKATPK
jgi:sugar lactone lactonase YvrE